MKMKSWLKMILAILVIMTLAIGQVVPEMAAAAGRDKERPTAPSDLHVVPDTTTPISITLSWNASSDNVGIAAYYIYIDGVLLASTAGTTFTATQLIPETTYTFYVKAKDPTGNPSPPSNTCQETTLKAPVQNPPPYRVVGYYTSWSAYHGFTPDKIDVSKVTHINYAFANIGSDLKIALGDATIDAKNFEKLRALKKFNPNLKTLISVGGWSWSDKFSDAALSPESRAVFARSCADFIVLYGFDGVDLDWEYPVGGGLASNTTRPEDRTNFTALLQALRTELDSRGPGYLLTIAGGAGQAYFNNVELDKIFACVDFVNAMTYDIHGGWDALTDFNAPLYTDPESRQPGWSVDDCVRLWLTLATVQQYRNKIVIGIPFYGRRYSAVKSTDPLTPGLYASFGRCTTITYQEIRNSYIPAYPRYFSHAAREPWLFDRSIFISYEDAESIGHKTGYIRQNQLGGAMVWELSQDADGELISATYDGLNLPD